MTLTFTHHLGGYVVRMNRTLRGLILAPLPDDRDWRILTEHGEMTTAPTLLEAKRLAADFLLLDHAA